jgi:hypothetical protein
VSSRTTRLVLIVGVALVAALGVVLAVSAFDGQETATKREYQETVVGARDRVDFAYAQITKADSVENLIERLDEASAAIEDVADDLSAAAVAPGFEDLNAELASKLQDFSDALAATADQFQDPSSAGFGLDSITSLGFTEWDDVNAILVKMQEKGIEVTLLERH